MGTSASPMKMKEVRKRLFLFGGLGILGVLLLAVSIVLGIIVLVFAEVFFVLAYRRFAKKPASAPTTQQTPTA